MDSFDNEFVNEVEADPAAEFLAREQDQLAGLEDEIPSVTMFSPNESTNNASKFAISFLFDKFNESFTKIIFCKTLEIPKRAYEEIWKVVLKSSILWYQHLNY